MMGVGFATAGAAYLIKPVLDGIFVNKNETMLKILPLAVLVLVTSKGVFLWGKLLPVKLRWPADDHRSAQETVQSYPDTALVVF